MLCCPEGYIDVTDGSRAMLVFLVGYMDVTEGSRAMLGYPECYMGVMEVSRAMPGCRQGTLTSRRGPGPC